MPFTPVSTPTPPNAIGTYSQAIKAGSTVYLSRPDSARPGDGELVDGDIEAQVRRVFENLRAVARAAGGDLADAVKVNVYLTDLGALPDSSTRSWPSISRHPIRHARPSASPRCRAAQRSRWTRVLVL